MPRPGKVPPIETVSEHRGGRSLRTLAGQQALCHLGRAGGVAEWSIAAVLKTVERASVPWVRIPPPPPLFRSRQAHCVRWLRGGGLTGRRTVVRLRRPVRSFSRTLRHYPLADSRPRLRLERSGQYGSGFELRPYPSAVFAAYALAEPEQAAQFLRSGHPRNRLGTQTGQERRRLTAGAAAPFVCAQPIRGRWAGFTVRSSALLPGPAAIPSAARSCASCPAGRDSRYRNRPRPSGSA